MMWPHTENVPLPPSVFTILRDLIHEHAGMYFDDAKRDALADKLSARVRELGFATFLDYYYLLKYGPAPEAEWSQVFDALSVPETYFWREIDQIHALTSDILPVVVAQCHASPVQIWCAACASGEEPLTIAMALEEAGWFERVPIQILGCDASPAAIAKARRGVYRERSFRSLPKKLLDKYFRVGSEGWEVTPELSARVKYFTANLAKAKEIRELAQSHIIFCRNVFIYFSPSSISRTVRLFATEMRRPGYLFLGASESLLKVSSEFELQTAGAAFVYYLK